MKDKFILPSRLRFIIKCVGAVALLNYFLFTRFSFEIIWFLFALLIAVGAPLFYAWVTVIFGLGAGRSDAISTAWASETYHPAEKFLISAEDGIFFLPLIYIGITPLTAFIAALLYALYRRNRHPLGYTLTCASSYFLMALWVLPEGLWIVFAGHVIAKIFVSKVFPHWFEQGFGEKRPA